MRNRRLVLILVLATVAYYSLVNRVYPNTPHSLTPEQFQTSVIIHALLITLFISLGYSLLVAFVVREGKRFFSAHAEIELAAGIQRALVPPLSIRHPQFEMHGLSLPSGVIGGDLLDVVPCGHDSLAYVADVSGHGVKAGVLMSMIKASVRTRFASADAAPAQAVPEDLLESLNNVLHPLTDSQSYATFAFLWLRTAGPLRFSLAGHLPIFHYQSGSKTVQQRSLENFPLAMFPGARFQYGEISAARGDLLAIVTDGLTELANAQGEEIGHGYIERALGECAGHPLEVISERIIQAGARFGHATDDRTLLLIRVL
jgi:serine phosphatase RsbU (regulator of sigma subunit)